MRIITRDELQQHDGKEGRSAWIAFMGMVYDVTDSPLWKVGRHQNLHQAGSDMSRELARAPHGAGILGKFKAVGKYSG